MKGASRGLGTRDWGLGGIPRSQVLPGNAFFGGSSFLQTREARASHDGVTRLKPGNEDLG
jgi:hypothetical protein